MELFDLDYRKPLIAVFGAVATNLLVVAYSQQFIGTNPDFEPLTYTAVGLATAISALGGWIVLELKKNYLDHPIEHFLKFSSFVLIASFGTVLYAVELPGAGMNEIAMLSLTHVVAATTIIGILLKLEIEDNNA